MHSDFCAKGGKLLISGLLSHLTLAYQGDHSRVNCPVSQDFHARAWSIASGRKPGMIFIKNNYSGHKFPGDKSLFCTWPRPARRQQLRLQLRFGQRRGINKLDAAIAQIRRHHRQGVDT